jgi:hypothetical protein
VVVGLGMIHSHDQTFTVVITTDVRAVPAGSFAARERHHDTIRSEQQST